MSTEPSQRPCLGYGLGLRPDHYEEILRDEPDIDWFEVVSENYMVDGGKPLYYLDRIRERYPLVMHGVSLSIGGTETKGLSSTPATMTCWTRSGSCSPVPYAPSAGDLGGLAPEAWPGMRIGFQHALRRLDLAWNVPTLWQAVDEDRDAPPAPERFAEPVAWVLWRKDLQVHWRSLDGDEAFALDAARDGLSFGDLCEGLLARSHDDPVPVRAAGFLKRWVIDELVAGVTA